MKRQAEKREEGFMILRDRDKEQAVVYGEVRWKLGGRQALQRN